MAAAFLALATAFGLSTSAGLNAYIPLLVVALLAKFTPLITLSEPYDALTSWWVIGVLGVLLIVEILVDKVPVADTANARKQGPKKAQSGFFKAGLPIFSVRTMTQQPSAAAPGGLPQKQ